MGSILYQYINIIVRPIYGDTVVWGLIWIIIEMDLSAFRFFCRAVATLVLAYLPYQLHRLIQDLHRCTIWACSWYRSLYSCSLVNTTAAASVLSSILSRLQLVVVLSLSILCAVLQLSHFSSRWFLDVFALGSQV